MKQFFSFLVLGCMLMLYQNCGEGFQPASSDSTLLQSQEPTQPVEVPETLASKTIEIMENRCNSCHGPNSANFAGINYVNDLDALINAGWVVPGDPVNSVLFQTVERTVTPMPPDQTQALEFLELETVREWILSLGPPPQPVVPTFAADVMPIIQVNCMGCHMVGGVAELIPLTNHAEVVVHVVPGDFATSNLWLLTQGQGGVTGDRLMPPATPLLQAQMDTIRDWIAGGALNN